MTRYKNCCIARKPIVNLITAFKVDVKVSQSYANENGGKTGGKVGGDVPSLSQALSQVERSAVEEDSICN
jgi:hypothetical protein